MGIIQEIKAREILDSRGIPTVEVDVITSEGIKGRAAVPSGASTGSYEAVEKRDGDVHRFHGKGVQKALANIQKIIKPSLLGKNVEDQQAIDRIMCQLDGTENKSQLGANATLAVSLASARAASQLQNKPLYRYLGQGPYVLPMPLVNILNGGAHADNNIDIQEFMIVPTGAQCFTEAIRLCSEVFHSLKALLKILGHNTNVGDEGGVAPNLRSSHEAFDILMQAIEKAGYRVGTDIKFALDIAANELYDGEKYFIDGKTLSSSEMVHYYQKLIESYPIISIEDGLSEDDWEGWQELTRYLGNRLQLVGDDLFVTNPKRLEKGFEKNTGNAILIKLNQIGTLSETLTTLQMAHQKGWKTIISHRSGETEDTFIADLSVAVGSGQIKTGSTTRSERLAKYNQLIRIEEELGREANFSCFGRLCL